MAPEQCLPPWLTLPTRDEKHIIGIHSYTHDLHHQLHDMNGMGGFSIADKHFMATAVPPALGNTADQGWKTSLNFWTMSGFTVERCSGTTLYGHEDGDIFSTAMSNNSVTSGKLRTWTSRKVIKYLKTEFTISLDYMTLVITDGSSPKWEEEAKRRQESNLHDTSWCSKGFRVWWQYIKCLKTNTHSSSIMKYTGLVVTLTGLHTCPENKFIIDSC